MSIVQRTPVLAVTRLFRTGQVISWNGPSWSVRTTASSVLPTLVAAAPDLDPAVARDVLDLALHWLSPTRSGATILIHDGDDDGSFDVSPATSPPALNVTDCRHGPPLLSALMQRDLATVFDCRGHVRAVGVGLRSSREAEARPTATHGMRHRSAERWSFDHPERSSRSSATMAPSPCTEPDGRCSAGNQDRPLIDDDIRRADRWQTVGAAWNFGVIAVLDYAMARDTDLGFLGDHPDDP